MQNLLLSERIKTLCKQKGISVKSLLTDCNMNRNTIYDLEKKGSFPSVDKIYTLADHLDCSVDHLLGRTISSSEINSHNTISGNNNVIGNGNRIGERLSEQETALLDIFKKINVVKQAQLLAYAAELEKEV